MGVVPGMDTTQKTNLILFRNDLRVHDHEALREASKSERLIPLYVFDPQKYTITDFGFPRVGPHRIRFLLETVENLRKNLQLRNSDLVIRVGRTEAVIRELVRDFGVNEVFLNSEVTSEEVREEHALVSALEPMNVRLQTYWGSTLYHRDDLPVEPHEVPDVFSGFRKRLEKKGRIREPVHMADKLPLCPVTETGNLPRTEALRAMPDHFLWDETRYESSGTAVLDFRGGEDAALQRVQEYIWDADLLKRYKETRNGLLGADYSSKFSPWLATGALSPRHIHSQVRAYEEERVKNKSTYWLIFELIWRDFFKFIFSRHGNALFKRDGIRETPHPVDWQRNEGLIETWQKGLTGIPFVDANMRELFQTGYMSNRGRQNAASFFSWNLRQEWRIGAAWFETLLLDYDPCSNWGNWAYNSGVGNDPRQRYFNILTQAERYDANGDFVRNWIPVLSNVPAMHVQEPHLLTKQQQQQYGVQIGQNYPKPVLDLEASYKNLKA